jgi:hypothetical protein
MLTTVWRKVWKGTTSSSLLSNLTQPRTGVSYAFPLPAYPAPVEMKRPKVKFLFLLAIFLNIQHSVIICFSLKVAQDTRKNM